MSTLLHSCGLSIQALFTTAAPSAASALVSSIWRGVLLVLVVTAVLSFLPRLGAATRSAIWLCVLVALVALPVSSLLLPAPTVSATRSALHVDPRCSYALLALWVTVSLVRLLQLAASAAQIRGLAKRSVPLPMSVATQRALANSHRRVQLCASADIDRPSAIGFFHPRILLPCDLLGSISESELEQIVLHELEHLRRHDDWTNLLQKLTLALLPLHPVVIWLDRRLCLERELACDDGVLRATQSRKSYAACLTNLAEQSLLRRGVSLALGALGDWKPKSEVARRVCRILREPQLVMGRTQSRVAAVSLSVGVVSLAVALARTPHLISFAPQPNVMQTAAVTPLAEPVQASVPTSHSVLAVAKTTGAPQATFAKAVMAPRATNAALRVSNIRKLAAKRVAAQRRLAPVPQSAPAYRLAAWQDDELPTPRFALAVQQDSQFTYAAVPVRGGWLVFQL